MPLCRVPIIFVAKTSKTLPFLAVFREHADNVPGRRSDQPDDVRPCLSLAFHCFPLPSLEFSLLLKRYGMMGFSAKKFGKTLPLPSVSAASQLKQCRSLRCCSRPLADLGGLLPRCKRQSATKGAALTRCWQLFGARLPSLATDCRRSRLASLSRSAALSRQSAGACCMRCEIVADRTDSGPDCPPPYRAACGATPQWRPRSIGCALRRRRRRRGCRQGRGGGRQRSRRCERSGGKTTRKCGLSCSKIVPSSPKPYLSLRSQDWLCGQGDCRALQAAHAVLQRSANTCHQTCHCVFSPPFSALC